MGAARTGTRKAAAGTAKTPRALDATDAADANARAPAATNEGAPESGPAARAHEAAGVEGPATPAGERGEVAPSEPDVSPPRPSGIVSLSAAEERIVEAAELTPEQIRELRARLEERRASLIAAIEGKRQQEREVGRDVGDEMDEASLEGASGMISKLLERDVLLLDQVNRALEKMRDGTYGVCEETGEPIGYARLKLQPWARYGIAWQEELERRARTRGSF
jgi:DnaK suppressor protein